MIIKEYSFKRSFYKKYSSLTLVIFLTFAFMTSYPSWEMIIYKMLLSIYAVSAMTILTEVVTRQVFHYVFSVPNPYWRKEIDRPRVAYLTFSLILALISFKLVADKGTEVIQYWSNCGGGILLLVIATFIIFTMWTKKFERLFIINPRAKLYNSCPIQCTVNSKDYDIHNIFFDLKDELNTSIEIFNAVVDIREIRLEERIIANYSKTDLIRFTYIFFNIRDKEPKFKKEFINKYFVDKEGKEFIQENEATFSRVDSEVRNKDKKFTNLEFSLTTIIERYRN